MCYLDEMKRVFYRLLLITAVVAVGGCATQKPGRIPKKGPIPCPMKDC
jgi:hypothetical protein